MRRRNYAHRVAKVYSDRVHSQACANLLGHPSSEIDGRNYNSARARDSPVGQFLPDTVLPVTGACLLLLCEQPFQGITGVLMCGVSVSVLFALVTNEFD